jgi:hypothetical protein
MKTTRHEIKQMFNAFLVMLILMILGTLLTGCGASKHTIAPAGDERPNLNVYNNNLIKH